MLISVSILVSRSHQKIQRARRFLSLFKPINPFKVDRLAWSYAGSTKFTTATLDRVLFDGFSKILKSILPKLRVLFSKAHYENSGTCHTSIS